MGQIVLDMYSFKKWAFLLQLQGLIVDKFVMMCEVFTNTPKSEISFTDCEV